MKKLVEVQEVANEGYMALMGQTITLFCLNYIYTGKLVGVNDTCILLESPKIVFETGAFDKSTWQDAQALPNSIYISTAAVEAFGVVK